MNLPSSPCSPATPSLTVSKYRGSESLSQYSHEPIVRMSLSIFESRILGPLGLFALPA